MLSPLRSLAAAVLLSFAATAAASDGHFIGSGSDMTSPSQGVAWFSADREFGYCIERAGNFPQGEAFLRGEIERAFSTWREYARAKHIRAALGRPAYRGPCRGGEDLSFRFGVLAADIEVARARYQAPAAFAELVHFDEAQAWGRGYVWVAPSGRPDWSKPERVAAILLHEIGHVMGCGHVPGTIMDARLERYLTQSYDDGRIDPHVRQIDWSRELVRCWDCAFRAEDEITGWLSPAASGYLRLSGRAALPAGRVRVSLTRAEGFESTPWRLRYETASDLAEYRLELEATSFQEDSSGDLFKTIVLGEGHPVYVGRAHVSRESVGTLVGPDGRESTVIVKVNQALGIWPGQLDGILEVWLVHGRDALSGTRRSLIFRSALPAR